MIVPIVSFSAACKAALTLHLAGAAEAAPFQNSN
jgi:hypothetical protein